MNNTVFIIDDDASVRDALGLMLSLRGYRTTVFADAASFLSAHQADWRGCLLVDIRMPGMNGLALQQALQDQGCGIPVVIITGHGDVTSAREAFRAAAIDFLEKPLDEPRLLQAIDEAFTRQSSSLETHQRRKEFSRCVDQLTPREREVMDLVVVGRHNREIAQELGISVRTVEVHKARMMAKLGVEGLPDLVRLSLIGHDENLP
jgi:FixJ family two-component response regulator